MPIKGLSDQVRLPRLGKIRLGIKVEGGKNPYPQPVNYFVCPDSVKSVFGDKPKELRILFPTEDPTKWASQFYRGYSKSRGLICKGDGERATALIDEDTGALADKDSRNTTLKEIECDPEHCPEYGKRCRRVMNLQFLLPDIPGLGVWQLDTSSYWSIININSGIKLVTALCGRISMIPLILRLVPQEAHPNGFKKTVYVLSLDIPGKLTDMLKYTQTPPGKAILPTPDAEAPEDLFPSTVLPEEENSGASLPLCHSERSEEPQDATPAQAPATQTDNHAGPQPDEPRLKSLGDLFTACHKHYRLSSAQVIKELGLSCKEEIADPNDAWQQIKALSHSNPEPFGSCHSEGAKRPKNLSSPSTGGEASPERSEGTRWG